MTEEIWRDIDGYDGKYQVSNFGRVKSFKYKTPRIMKPYIDIWGYMRIDLTKNNSTKHRKIHQLVAEEFITNPDNKPHVNHIDGNKLNNCANNLEWCTPAENARHADEHGLLHPPKGAAHHAAKFTDEQVRYIRQVFKAWDSHFGAKALAKQFGVDSTSISNVVHRRTYKNVE